MLFRPLSGPAPHSFLFNKNTENLSKRLVEEFPEASEAFLALFSEFQRILKAEKLKQKELEKSVVELNSKLEKSLEALENRNKDYNKLKRFLISLQQEESEESEKEDSDAEFDILTTKRKGECLNRNKS